MAAESGVSGGYSPTGNSLRRFSIQAIADADVEPDVLISNLVQSRINAPVAPAGSGWESHPLNGLSNFFLVNTSLAPGVIESTEGEVSQVRGYHATVTYNLGRNIIRTDTGDLTVAVTLGDLGVDAVVVDDGTDFTCDAGIDQCVYDFDADGDGADDVGRDSLNLVLSLAIGGTDNLEMTLTANVGNPFDLAANNRRYRYSGELHCQHASGGSSRRY